MGGRSHIEMTVHKMKKRKHTDITDSMVWVGFGLTVFYWFVKSLTQLFIYSEFNFFQLLIGVDIYEIYERLIVLCMFIIFSSHIHYNIMERRKTEKSLQESEKKYRTILESIEEGYYEVDITGNFTFFNDSLCKILGYTKDELIGMNLKQYMNEDNAKIIFHAFDEILNSEKYSGILDCEFIGKSGQHRIIEISISIMMDSNEQPIGFRGITRDITEKKMLERNLIQSYKDVQNTRAGTILGLAKLAEFRDKDTGRHLERIREYTRILAEEMAKHSKYKGYITKEYRDDISLSSILHDIGKVGVPDSILLKPGKLTSREFEEIKEHVLLGGDTLNTIDSRIDGRSFLTIGKEIAYHHHEKWDGTGYPDGLKGEDIPLSARLVGLADVYDALTSKRSYKDAYSHKKAKKIIIDERGKHFDPDIVDAFLIREDDFNMVRDKMSDDK